MPDLEALLAAVVAAPAEDAPRLAYGDAVASTDPDRAGFIRAQIANARSQPMSNEAMDTSIRAQILLGRHRQRWEADVQPPIKGGGFRRGFVELIEVGAAEFLATARALYRRAPILDLNLTGVRPVAAALFQSPHLARIFTLSLLRNGLGDAEVALLAQSPHLGRLMWLDLSLNSIGQAGLEALAASDRLPRLEYVGLASNQVADPTPTHCDGYDQTSPVARALMDAYGPRAWLDARERAIWPPYRERCR